jgi:hypothetical protein
MREFQERNPSRVFAMQFTGEDLDEFIASLPLEPEVFQVDSAGIYIRWPNGYRLFLMPEEWLVAEGMSFRPMTDGEFCKRYEPICDHEWDAMSLTKNGLQSYWCEKCDWYKSERVGTFHG